MIAKYIKSILFFLIILYANIVYGIEVSETDNQPVQLNNKEIFFPGGWKYENINGQKSPIVVPARIYNIKKKKFIDLNTTMKVPRNNYVAAKTGNKVLIAGGNDINNDLSNTAEIYDIEKRKFEQINDSIFTHWDHWSQIFPLKDNRIFLMHYCEGEIFNPANNSFSIAKDKEIINSNIAKFKPICNACLLKDGRIAKYYGKNFELYNPYTNDITDISVPDSVNWSNKPIVLDNGNLLLIAWDGNENGTVYEFNPKNNEFKRITDLNPSATDINSTLLNSDIILMTRGIIRMPDINPASYDSGKCFSSALYSISKNKMYRIENTSCDFKGKEYVFKKNNKSAIIFITNKKPIILPIKRSLL